MLFVLIYLAIGGLLVAGFAMGCRAFTESLFEAFNGQSSLWFMIVGYMTAMALIIIWLPFVIGCIILKIFDK